MPAYLICDTCLRLWDDYGSVTNELKAGTGNLDLILEATDAIRVHEAEAHPKAHVEATRQIADKAKAVGA